MRYRTISSFYQHLKSSYPDHLLSRYGVFASDAFERRHLSLLVSSLFGKSPVFKAGEDDSLAKIISEMNSPSLFGESPLIIVERDLKKAECLELAGALKRFEGRFLLLSGTSTLYGLGDIIEKEGALCDFLKDKKWEREKRFQEYVHMLVRKRKKAISDSAVNLLFQKIGPDLAQLLSETEKLSVYVGERPRIEEEDISQMVANQSEKTIWQIADQFVFARKVPQAIDLSQMAIFFTALRSQFQMGYKMLSLMEKKEEIGPHFPKLWPRMIDQKKREALNLKKDYFKRGLIHLFEAESAFRNERTIHPHHLYAKINTSTAS